MKIIPNRFLLENICFLYIWGLVEKNDTCRPLETERLYPIAKIYPEMRLCRVFSIKNRLEFKIWYSILRQKAHVSSLFKSSTEYAGTVSAAAAAALWNLKALFHVRTES